jgi:uncharacterized RmlC-like cupin family protein
VQDLIHGESCGADDIYVGLWWLHPGAECKNDIRADAVEIYYALSGERILRPATRSTRYVKG